MDTKLIKQYGEEILCYRLRNARQKKRMQYEDFDKQLIQLHKRRQILWEKKRNLGWEPLIPPVQKGWKRLFVLRDDVSRSKQADFFEEILKKINTHDWSYRKDFLVKRRRFGRKIYVIKGQRLLEPDEYHFKKLNFTEKEQQFFYPVLRASRVSKQLVKHFVFIEPWRFVLRVKPNIIDKIRVKDADLESEIARLRNFLERNDLENRLDKITRGNTYKWWKWGSLEKYDEKNIYKNKSLEQLIDITSE
ncbi:MAG: hypothetical protein ABUT20_56805 [Bacteroidota bacterium]